MSTKDNAADDLTRSKAFDSLQKASRWCNSPDFLYNSLQNHEIINVNAISTKDKDKTLRRTSNNGQSTVLPTSEVNTIPKCINKLVMLLIAHQISAPSCMDT